MTLQQTSPQDYKNRIRQLENLVEKKHNEINDLKQSLEQRDQWAIDSEKSKTEAERQRKQTVEMYMELQSKYLVLEREKNEAASIVSKMTEEKEILELQNERIQTALELSDLNVAELERQNLSLREQLDNARQDIAVNPQDVEPLERDRENKLIDELQREIVSLREQATSIVSKTTEEKQILNLQNERIQTALELSDRNVAELERQNLLLREQLDNARQDIPVNPQDVEPLERDCENELIDELQREIVSLREQLQNAHLMIQWQEQEFQGELQMLARRTAAGAVAAVGLPVAVPAVLVVPLVNEVVCIQEGTDFAQGILDNLDE